MVKMEWALRGSHSPSVSINPLTNAQRSFTLARKYCSGTCFSHALHPTSPMVSSALNTREYLVPSAATIRRLNGSVVGTSMVPIGKRSRTWSWRSKSCFSISTGPREMEPSPRSTPST